MQDKIIKCRDCGAEFVFTAGEQDFYAQRGFGDPSRCPACRAARRGSRGEGGPSPYREREMYPAVCARCGKETQVPFQPRADRPVYCSECYSAQRPAAAGHERRPGGGRPARRGSRDRGDRDERW
ncbi:MAG: zinc-ribbon domain containing protein [Anaerolineae bacterium]|nr:zinc-ribbon domain containing protein [Anaerolineae bacterium]